MITQNLDGATRRAIFHSEIISFLPQISYNDCYSRNFYSADPGTRPSRKSFPAQNMGREARGR